jgi:ABC-2 type transport system permease protein
MVVWNAEFILRTSVCLVFCLICISTFALIGLFLSTRTRESVVSLVTALLVWVVLVVVIPAVGNLLARGFIKVPQQDQVQEEAERAFGETIQNYNRSHPHPDNWIASGQWSPGEPLLRAFEANQARSRVMQSYQERLLEQVTLGRRIAAISPAALFSQSLEIAVESGISHYRKFMELARRYREALGEFLDRIYPLDKAYPLDRSKTDRVLLDMKLSFDSIPKFEDRFASMGEAGSQLVWNGGILLALNVLLFVAAYLSFLRYDVR